MNELSDWFPEGEDAFGNSSLDEESVKPFKFSKKYLKREEKRYLKWLKTPKEKRELDFIFVVRLLTQDKQYQHWLLEHPKDNK